MLKRINGRPISKGLARGSALVSGDPLSFLGGVDATTGNVVDQRHDLYGYTVADRILVFPTGKGSTVGSYVLYQLKKKGVAPAAIINEVSDTITTVGAIISDIPLIDKLEDGAIELIQTGSNVFVNCFEGFIEVEL